MTFIEYPLDLCIIRFDKWNQLRLCGVQCAVATKAYSLFSHAKASIHFQFYFCRFNCSHWLFDAIKIELENRVGEHTHTPTSHSTIYAIVLVSFCLIRYGMSIRISCNSPANTGSVFFACHEFEHAIFLLFHFIFFTFRIWMNELEKKQRSKIEHGIEVYFWNEAHGS